jgi:hypothetical protein
MTETRHPKVSLKLIHPVPGVHFLNAPPVLIASTHTVDFCCGNCETILMHAESDQVHGLIIRCSMCGCTNTTDK